MASATRIGGRVKSSKKETERAHMRVCVCVCMFVRAYVRTCVRAYVRACVQRARGGERDGDPMVQFVGRRPTQDAGGEDVVEHPWKVKPTVQLCEQVGDDNVVENATERVRAEEVERDNVGEDLHAAVCERVVDHLRCVQGGFGMMLRVPHETQRWELVHGYVEPEKQEVVHEQPSDQLPSELGEGRRGVRKNAAGIEEIEDEQGREIGD